MRVLKPGGTFVLVAWCHREEPPALREDEQLLLKRIYKGKKRKIKKQWKLIKLKILFKKS